MTTQQQHWGQPPADSKDTTLFLVRHGETLSNQQGRVQGHGDSPLSARGFEQGMRVARRLAAIKIDTVYSSDSQRAMETARLFAGPHKLEITARESLRERNFGVLEGKTLEETGKKGDTWFLSWLADRRVAPPAGESQDQMCERFMEALRAILAAHPGQHVAISTHGGPIKSAVYDILRIPTILWRLTWIENGSITVLRGAPDVLRVATFNDTCHLEGVTSTLSEAEG